MFNPGIKSRIGSGPALCPVKGKNTSDGKNTGSQCLMKTEAIRTSEN